jgi:hypothetical protein
MLDQQMDIALKGSTFKKEWTHSKSRWLPFSRLLATPGVVPSLHKRNLLMQNLMELMKEEMIMSAYYLLKNMIKCKQW